MIAVVTLQCIRSHMAYGVFRDGNEQDRGMVPVGKDLRATLEREHANRFWLRCEGDRDTMLRVSAKVFGDCWKSMP